MQRVNNIALGATLYFGNYTKAIASHACSSIYAHSDTASPVYILLSKVFVKKPTFLSPGGTFRKLMQHRRSSFFFSRITHERKNGTNTSVDWSS